MILSAQIRHALDLVIRLTDTATGRIITGQIETKINNKTFLHQVSSDGELLFVNTGREDFEFYVSAKGYEPISLAVKYEALAENPPYIDIHLIPDEKQPCFTLQGKLKGIKELDAVKISQNPCIIKEFDSRKRILTMFNPYALMFDRLYYAVLNTADEVYEPFAVIKQISDTEIKIENPLEKPFEQFPVIYRVKGKAEKGEYLLRVSDDGSSTRWVIRFVTDKGEFFQTVDFSKPEAAVLSEKGGGSH
jgi:hypothetical protein